MFSGRVRAAGAAALALIGYWGATAAIAVPVIAVIPARVFEGPAGIAVGSLPLIGAAFLVNWLFVWRGWTSWQSLGWARRGERGTGKGLGRWAWGAGALGRWTLFGIALAAVALTIALAAGGALARTPERVTAYLLAAGAAAVVLLLAALSEELLFRGYPLARLSKTVGRAGASVVLAAGFALIHVANPEVTAYGLVNIGLASLVLSAAFFTRGGMLAAWGVHFGWNAGIGILADAPVSGVALDMPVLEYSAGRHEWITGGAFGPEGGLAATVATLVGLVVLVRTIKGMPAGGAT